MHWPQPWRCLQGIERLCFFLELALWCWGISIGLGRLFYGYLCKSGSFCSSWCISPWFSWGLLVLLWSVCQHRWWLAAWKICFLLIRRCWLMRFPWRCFGWCAYHYDRCQREWFRCDSCCWGCCIRLWSRSFLVSEFFLNFSVCKLGVRKQLQRMCKPLFFCLRPQDHKKSYAEWIEKYREIIGIRNLLQNLCNFGMIGQFGESFRSILVNPQLLHGAKIYY